MNVSNQSINQLAIQRTYSQF